MNLSIEQSEINEMTDRIEKFSALVNLYNDRLADKDLFLSELFRFESVDWTKENMFNQLLAYNALGAAYSNLKSKSLDYTKAYYDNEYVYKEISYYHNVQYIVARVTEEQLAALYYTAARVSCYAYLGLANAYDHIGRFSEALQFFKLARLDSDIARDVEINLGYLYANMHSFWTEEEPWIVRKAQQLMRKHERQYNPGLMATINGWVAPSSDMPQVDFSRIENGVYEWWVNENYLRINRFCDVEQFSQLSLLDNVNLPYVNDTKERKQLFETSFEEIKNTFIDTRRMVFQSIVGEGDVNTELLKMLYKHLYSIFDKIAVFLQAYLTLPIEVYQADFAKIWYDKKNNIRQEFVTRAKNLSLLALYNVSLDVYGSKKFGYVVDEQTKDLQRIRNYIEHKIIRINEGPMSNDDYQLTISKHELTINIIRLAQLVRCSIIYLCNFVMHSEYDKSLK